MSSIVPRHRAHRGWFLVAVAGLLTPVLFVESPGAAPEVAAQAVTEDHSNEMPRTRHNEVTGDFLSRGYDQRAVVETGNLNIYDSAAKGGALLRSTPTDLFEPTTDNEYNFDYFALWQPMSKDNSLGAIALNWAPGYGFFMAGSNKAAFEHRLYKLPTDGSCAQQSCADWVTTLPGFAQDPHSPLVYRWVTTGALAVGTIGTTPVLAVGLTWTRQASATFPPGPLLPGGIYVVDPGDGSVLGTYSDDFPSGDQTVVTALDWDDNGSGLLAIGLASLDDELHAVRVSADGTFSNHTRWDGPPRPPQTLPSTIALSAAIGHRADGSPVVAYGMSDGAVKLWDPAVTTSTLLSEFTGATDAVNALTFTDRIDDTVGLPDLVAVSSRGNSARVLRYSGATTLAPLPVAAGGVTSTDVGGIRAWFPGYKTGEVLIEATTEAIQVDFATRPNAAYGCWFSKGFVGRPAFPTTPVILGFGESATFALGTLTAGEGGDCAATDFTGQWAVYMVVTPLARPADRTVAKLVLSRSGQLTVSSVGGSLKMVVAQAATSTYPLGWSRILVQSPSLPPRAPSSLTVTGKRLDPAGTDRPVYRFDVAATTWPLPPSTPPRVGVTLPALQVRGLAVGGDDIALGLLVPQGRPSRTTSGSVTLSPVSFYWQNPAVGPQITDVYVRAPAFAVTSTRVNLAGLAAPAPGTTVGQLIVCPASGSTSCDSAADPVANGLDQAPLRIQVYDGNSAVLPLTDPMYGQIYYRDQDGDLLTGLIPADGSSYIRVSPYAGAYPNDGSTSSTTRPPTNGTVGGRFGYLTTTSTVEQQITAHVGGSTLASDPTTVDAIDLTPQAQAGAQAGAGFYVTGCAGDYSGTNFCRLAQITPTAPGLFLTSDPTTGELRIGLQFATIARTSLTSLPLQQVAGQPEHTVAANPLTINNGEISLNTTSGFQPGDAIDTWVITHGTQIAIRDINVGGGN